MVVFPNAKINLGLNIIEKRTDGYHNIESCFYPIPLTDALEVIESDKLSFTSSGIPIPGDPESNLCLKAYHLLKKHYDLPLVEIHLHKNIPIGAGLGGGSSDGAFMLKLLNEKFELGIDNPALEKLAGELGSDCPFFIENKPVFVEGKGNVFSPVEVSLKGKYLVLVMPDVHVSTAQAYAGITPQQPEAGLKEILEQKPMKRWQDLVKNDFEESVFAKHPELERIKNQLIEEGAIYASMTGSGAAVFGVFEEKPILQLGGNWQIDIVKL